MEGIKKFFGIQTRHPMEEPVADKMDKLITHRKWLLKNVRFDEFRLGFAAFSDKPVYNPGETVRMFVLIYEKWCKRPLLRKELARRFSLDLMTATVRDSSGKAVLQANLRVVEDWSGLFFEFPLSPDASGGVYRASVDYDRRKVDQLRFFVKSVQPVANRLELQLDKEWLVGDARVVGKATLRALTRAKARALDQPVDVKVYGKEMALVAEVQTQLEDGECVFAFDCKAEWGCVSVVAATQFEGETLRATGRLQVKELRQMQVKFVPSGGKFVVGAENEVYFASFVKGQEAAALPFRNGQVWEVDLEAQSQAKVAEISSNANGRGKFKVRIRDNCHYHLKLREESQETKFTVLGKEDLGKNYESRMSPVKLDVSARVVDWGQDLKIGLERKQGTLLDKYRLVLMDKMRVHFETEVAFESERKLLRLSLELSKLRLANGGVVQLQVYKSSNTRAICQESLLFVRPPKKLPIRVETDKQKYLPGDPVQMRVSVIGKRDAFLGIVVSDETAYLEADPKRRPLSMFTKVFLEKEVRFQGKGDFMRSDYFVDWMFENNPERLDELLREESGTEDIGRSERARLAELELLLGLQHWRLFMFGETRLRELISQFRSGKMDKQVKRLFPVHPQTLGAKLDKTKVHQLPPSNHVRPLYYQKSESSGPLFQIGQF